MVKEIKDRQIKLELPNNISLTIIILEKSSLKDPDCIVYDFRYRYLKLNAEKKVELSNIVSLRVEYLDGIVSSCELCMEIVFPERRGKEFLFGADVSPNSKMFIEFLYKKEIMDVSPGNQNRDLVYIKNKLTRFILSKITVNSKVLELKKNNEGNLPMRPIDFPFSIKDSIENECIYGFRVTIPHSELGEYNFSFPNSIKRYN